MLDIFYKIQDGASKVISERTQQVARVHASALASVGYQLMRLTKEGIQRRAPGDVVWPALHPWSATKTLKGGKIRTRRRSSGNDEVEFFSRNATVWPILSRAVKYQKQNADGQNISQSAIRGGAAYTIVRMGFLSAKTRRIAAQIATGETIGVTPQMRRKIFALGLAIAKSSITIPQREHVGAIYRKYHGRMVDFIRARINAAWAGQDPKAAAPSLR